MYTSVLVCGVILVLYSSESSAQTSFDVIVDTQNRNKCGRSNVATLTPLITNGSEAQAGTFPWHAGLYFRIVKDGAESWEQKCGGSLITDQFILTAAHCVYKINKADVRVALGKYFRSWDHYEYSEQKRNVSQIKYPHEFDTKTYYFDVALLLLDEKIKLGELTMPVCTGLLDVSNYILNKRLFVAGWGRTTNYVGGISSNTLLYNDVMFLPTSACQHFIPTVISLFDKICTMKNNSVVSVAQPGDSGGGLSVVHNGLHYIVGIVSIKLADMGNSLAFFTNISWPTHLMWIENEIREYDSKFRWSGDEGAKDHSSSNEEFPALQGFGVFESPEFPTITGSQNPLGAKTPPGEKSGDTKFGSLSSWLDKFRSSPGQDGNYTISSYKSVIQKTVTLPDGTVKKEEIIRNSNGSDERDESHSEPQGPSSPFANSDFSDLFKLAQSIKN